MASPEIPQSPDPDKNLPPFEFAEKYRDIDMVDFSLRMQDLCNRSLAEKSDRKYTNDALTKRREAGFRSVKAQLGINDDSVIKATLITAEIDTLSSDEKAVLPKKLRVFGNMDMFLMQTSREESLDIDYPKIVSGIVITGIADTYDEPIKIKALVRTDDIIDLKVLQ